MKKPQEKLPFIFCLFFYQYRWFCVRRLILLSILSLSLFVNAALQPEFVVNDGLKQCGIWYPTGENRLSQGWSVVASKPIYQNEQYVYPYSSKEAFLASCSRLGYIVSDKDVSYTPLQNQVLNWLVLLGGLGLSFGCAYFTFKHVSKGEKNASLKDYAVAIAVFVIVALVIGVILLIPKLIMA